MRICVRTLGISYRQQNNVYLDMHLDLWERCIFLFISYKKIKIGDFYKRKVIYPKWNGITILSKNAKTILIVPIRIEFLNVFLLKTVSPIIKIINSKTERGSKYPQPYTKVILNNTAKINIDNMNAGLLFPFVYQQTNAKNGEIMVKPTQIIA